jgi:hypothetical protein
LRQSRSHLTKKGLSTSNQAATRKVFTRGYCAMLRGCGALTAIPTTVFMRIVHGSCDRNDKRSCKYLSICQQPTLSCGGSKKIALVRSTEFKFISIVLPKLDVVCKMVADAPRSIVAPKEAVTRKFVELPGRNTCQMYNQNSGITYVACRRIEGECFNPAPLAERH